MTYVLALVAAVAYGANWVLQQHEAALAPTALQLRPVLLLEHLIRRPLWLVGLLAMGVGAAAQEGALVSGSLPVIESLLVLDLVFAMVLANRLSSRSVSWLQWCGAAAVCVGLAGFLVAADPTAGHGVGDSEPWLAVLVVIGGLTALLCMAAWRAEGAVRAVLCATAASILFGLSDGLSKAAFNSGFPHAPISWQLYALIGTAVAAVAASQVAFNAAPLVVSLPSLAVGEPVVGVAVGVMVLHVRFRTGTAALAVEVIGAVMVVLGSYVVSRAPVLHLHLGRGAEAVPHHKRHLSIPHHKPRMSVPHPTPRVAGPKPLPIPQPEQRLTLPYLKRRLATIPHLKWWLALLRPKRRVAAADKSNP